jgi:putative transposase
MKVEPPFLPAIDVSSWVYSIILTSRTRLKVLVQTSFKVDPRDTTQMCSNCGSILKKTLSERVHECPYCGFIADRDYNAAVNIHRVGMEQPFEPVEPRHLHHISVAQVLAMIARKPRSRSAV